MSAELNGKRVAFLVTDGFEQVELTGPARPWNRAARWWTSSATKRNGTRLEPRPAG